MSRFDFRYFLERNHIPYVEKGPNTAKGHISIKCPFCGNADPSEHMGIQLATNRWGCLRVSSHRGRDPARLVAKLLGCTTLRARTIVREDSFTDPSEFDLFIEKMQEPEHKRPAPSKSARLAFLPNMRPLTHKSYGRVFYQYLYDRGFTESQIPLMAKEYKLRYCITGFWRWRLIIPVYLDGRLVQWTGRSIRKDATLRYRSLPSEDAEAYKDNPEMPVAPMSIKETIWNFDSLYDTGGRRLYILEGPFDALKFDVKLRLFNIRATCLFSASMSFEQRYLLMELADRFDQIVVVMDPEQYYIAVSIAQDLGDIGAGYAVLSQEHEDPGAMTGKQILNFAGVSNK